MAPAVCGVAICIALVYGAAFAGYWRIGNNPLKRYTKKNPDNYSPTTRSIAPTSMPNMDVDADSIPRMI